MSESDVWSGHAARCLVEHRLVEIGGDDLRIGEGGVQRLGDHARAGSGFEDAGWVQCLARVRLQARGVRPEQQRDHVAS